MTDVKWVFARQSSGMMEASATRRRCTPLTEPSGFTTPDASVLAVIRQVPAACGASPSSNRVRRSRSSSFIAKTSSRLRPEAPKVTERAPRAIAGCRTISAPRRRASRIRAMSRESESMLASTSGSWSGSGEEKRTLPREKAWKTATPRAPGVGNTIDGNAQMVERDHQHVAPSRAAHAGRVADAAVCVTRVPVARCEFLLQAHREAKDGMFEKVASDVRQVAQRNNAEIAQHRDRSESGTDQHSRGVD